MMPAIYTKASYCKRGHWISWNIAKERADYCKTCGAVAIEGCPSCGASILGIEIDPAVVVIGGSVDPPPNFCRNCGAPFPWVGREGRIHELQNMLDRQELDPATELAVREQLDALASSDLEPAEEKKRWEKVKKLAPELWVSGRPILESLISAAVRQPLGL
jgi:hypothetical protein